MLKKTVQVDSNGLFIQDILINDTDKLPLGCIDTDKYPIQGGLYLPKWDSVNKVWIEGKVIDPVVTLQNAKDAKILELNKACNQTILAGFTSPSLGASHTYKFDMEYQANQTAELGMLNADPTYTGVKWPTVDAGVLDHSRAQFLQLCKDAKTFKEFHSYRYHAMKAQVLATTTDTITKVSAFIW